MGSLQVGMLRALIEQRIRPDLVLGCSIGALNGVMVAADPSLAAVGRLQDIWMDLVGRDLLPAGFLPSTMQMVRKGESIQSSAALRDLISEVLTVERFDDLAVRFQCIATDIDGALGHWFHEGALAEALLASASIPAVFPAVTIDGRRYIDGAVVDDVPVARAVELGATKIYVLQVGGVDRPRPEPKRPLDMAVLAYWIARRNRLLDDLARIPSDVEVVILPHGDPTPVRYNDLSHSAQLMDIAYRATRDHLVGLAAGEIAHTFGPLTHGDLPLGLRPASLDDEAELAAAQQLVEAVGELHTDDGGESGAPTVLEAELLSRAESFGPAMRAMIDRVRLRGDRAIARVFDRRDDDGPPDAQVLDDGLLDPIDDDDR